jgi:hypothetical protein
MNPQDMITDKQQYQNPIANFFNILFAESLRNDRNEIQIDGFAGLVNILCQWGIAPTIQEVGMTCDEKASSYHRTTPPSKHSFENRFKRIRRRLIQTGFRIPGKYRTSV